MTRSRDAEIQKDNFKIEFNSQELEWKPHVRYLGVHFDPKLSFGHHVDTVNRKSKQAMATLYCLLKKYSRVRCREKLTIYRSYIRPIFSYSCPVFLKCAKTHIQKLQVTQNKCLRMALNAPYCTRISELHDLSRIPYVKDFFDKIHSNLMYKSQFSENKLVRALC